jgi:hypothetical protein
VAVRGEIIIQTHRQEVVNVSSARIVRGVLNGVVALGSAYMFYLGVFILAKADKTYDGKPVFGLALSVIYWALFWLILVWKSAHSKWEIALPFAGLGLMVPGVTGIVLLVIALFAAISPTWKARRLAGEDNGWWNPREHTDDDNTKWAWLRAVEWNSWPSFVTIPLVPLAFLYVKWWKVLLTILLANLFWFVIRKLFLSLHLAEVAAWLNPLRWPVSLGMTIYFGIHRQFGLGVLSLAWPSLAGLIGPPVWIGPTQDRIMMRLGYTRETSSGA